MNEADTRQLIIAHRGQRKPSPEFSAVLARELALTAETLAAQLTELRVVGFAEALAGMDLKIMSLGFRKARRDCEYFPKPKQIREWGAEEWERIRPKYQGLPMPRKLTLEEQEADKKLWEETMSKLGPSKK